MTWDKCIEILCMRINRFTYALWRRTKVVNQYALLVACHGHVTLIIRYGIMYWRKSKDSPAVFIARKRCFWSICGLCRMDSYISHFKEARLLTVP